MRLQNIPDTLWALFAKWLDIDERLPGGLKPLLALRAPIQKTLHVPLHDSAALHIDRVEIRNVVPRAMRVEDENLMVADAADVVFALEDKPGGPPIGFYLPFARLAVA
jgi:hypothetical protein